MEARRRDHGRERVEVGADVRGDEIHFV